MSFRLLLACLLLMLSSVSGAYHEADEPTDGTVRSFKPLPQPLVVPAISFLDGDGKATSIEAFRGKLVLLNVWATWCGPCIRELPGLDRLQKKFSDTDLVVLPVSTDQEGIAASRPYYQYLKIQNLGLYNDPGSALGVFFPMDVVPASFIIDRHGKVISFLRSYVDWDEPLASEMIQYYLSQTGEDTKPWTHH